MGTKERLASGMEKLAIPPGYSDGFSIALEELVYVFFPFSL